MCGIVGFIGNDDAKKIILHGLEKLEYRGYDSAGIALLDEELQIFKDKGRIANLRSIVGDATAPLGIGHTRWATHGKPNKVNSHPHQSTDGRFVIVHNGVIENYEQLKDKYLKESNLVSETDTEVIVELLSVFVKRDQDVETAIRHLMNRLHGSFALGIIDTENPEVLYAIKNKSPLLVGVGSDFNMIGSDAMAMLQKTNTFYELHDQEYVKLTKDGVEIFEITGALVEDRDTFTSTLDAGDIEKGTYKHFMMKEIDEQPFVIRKLIQEYQKDNKLYIDEDILNTVKECDRIYIIAAGTSYHAGLVGKQLFETIAHIPTEVHISSEFVYNMPLVSKKPLFIFISQSGETADSRAVLVKIKGLGYKSLTITNVEGSTLSREADHTLLLHAGPEIAVASTKAYTAQIALLVILSSLLSKEEIDLMKELAITANIMESICDQKEHFEELAKEFLTDQVRCFYIGRHVDYYTAIEASLKMKEISYVQTEGFAAGELKHGTIALIEDKIPVIAIISQESINLNTRANIKEVKARGANTLVIATRSLSTETDQVVFDDVHPYLRPLLTVIPTQFLAYYTALHRGLDIDKPRNLAKSVTVE